MGIPANEADPEVQSEELVLVQGIIDLYFEEPDGLVLLDYKTDSVKTAGQLLDRYQTQMDLYARALAAATGKPVKEKIIYSFKLEEMIYA
jgi:ATP-dependent helicase/nuclease subunit A